MYTFKLLKVVDGIDSTLQVLYLNHEDGREYMENTLVDLFEQYNRRIAPSRLLIVCPSGIESVIKSIYEDHESRFKHRLVSTSHVVIAPFDQCGQLDLDCVVQLKQSGQPWKLTDEFLLELSNDGIAELFDNTKAILFAPHGYVFLKPSGREETIFVRAGNILRESGCISMLNHLLLRKLPQNCNKIFIDSFTILSIAMGLQSIIAYFHRLSPESVPIVSIENTHSYEIDDIQTELRIPNDPNYLVLISASTSGGYAKKLVEEKQADPSRIIHLLGVAPADREFRTSCVYFREHELSNANQVGKESRKGVIQIDTEEFLVAQGPPRPVKITKEHVSKEGAREFPKLFYQSALSFFEARVTPQSGFSPFSISVQIEDANSVPIKEWITKSLIHELPASVRAIVHIGDPMSEIVANWIGENLVGEIEIGAMGALQVEGEQPGDKVGACVVVAFQDPGLDALSRTSIELRNKNYAHHHYVVCYAFPPSLARYNRLKGDLRLGQLGWSEFLVLPVGASSLHSSLYLHRQNFTDELLLPYKNCLGDNLTASLLEQNSGQPIPIDKIFLPRIDGAPLRLRPTSIFFEESSEIPSQAVVYAMTSAAMQRAREPLSSTWSTNPSVEMIFDDNPFVRSVLDPSMFARFNDGILQAALLRTAHPYELDYSASDEFSLQFSDTFESIIENRNNEVGEAVLEFVYALATQKVSLRKEDRIRLEEKVNSISALKAFLDLLESSNVP